MFPFLPIIGLIFRSISTVLFEPMFWLVILLVGFQYRQQQRNQEQMFGVAVVDWKRQTVNAAWLGLAGGCLGSVLLTVVGVSVNGLGLSYIWPVAIALMLIHARFLCFAYAGGLVALAYLLFGWPVINVPHVLALIAILHITESCLIAISVRFSATPVIIRRGDRLVGAFSLQNFWPLPLVVLLVVGMGSDQLPTGMVNMPNWWPLLPFGSEPPAGKQWVHMLIPVVAALGYADLAVSTRPEQKRRESAIALFVYSLVLLVMAILSARHTWLQFPAAVLSPLGHDLLIKLQSQSELKGQPLYVPAAEGLSVLDVIPDSPAEQAGVRSGDVLLSIYGMEFNSEIELTQAISYAPRNFSLRWQRAGQDMLAQASFVNGERRLGVILVPRGGEYHLELDTESFGFIKRLWRKWKVGK